MKRKSAQEFYNGLSADYDSMIGFDASLKRRTEALRSFILEGDEAAADLGCGSGLDTIALANLGLRASGFDISAGMIKNAKANALRLGVKAGFYSCPVKNIPIRFNGKFNFALSLGNSLANINEKELSASLKKIYSLLKPGGHILIQILNYDRILRDKNRIVGVNNSNGITFLRFYDFQKEKTFFNILKFDPSQKPAHSLITTEIFPYKKAQIISLIKKAGFGKIKIYGGLNKEEYKKGLSQDIVITAFKN